MKVSNVCVAVAVLLSLCATGAFAAMTSGTAYLVDLDEMQSCNSPGLVWTRYNSALPASKLTGDYCDACVIVTGATGSVLTRVQGTCSSCGEADIGLSPEAMAVIRPRDGPEDAVLDVYYTPVDCAVVRGEPKTDVVVVGGLTTDEEAKDRLHTFISSLEREVAGN